MSLEDILKARRLVSLVIRRWRGNLYLSGESYSDKELAKMVGITPTAFSRLSNCTATATLPVYRALQVAIIDTLGYPVMKDICDSCKSEVYGN